MEHATRHSRLGAVSAPVAHVAYDECRCKDSPECLSLIRAHIDHGWSLVAVPGPKRGPFLLLFRKDGP